MDIEEIRFGVWQILYHHKKEYEWSGVMFDILSYLAEKGACFPVEGELPSINLDDYEWRDFHSIINVTRRVMLEATYKKVITLKEMMSADK